jgi:ferric-dicitrate binding protein FerR (iron transport regulator)
VVKRAGTGGAADRRRALQPHRRRSIDRRARGYRLLLCVLVAAALFATLAIDGVVLPR